MRLIVGKLGDSQEVPGNNPFHAFALAVGNEFNRLKGMQGREHSATLVGRATPFGQLHDSTPFQPGDTAKEQQKRGKNAPKQEQQKQEDPKKQGGGVSFSAGFSSGKKGKGTPEAAAIVLNATGPLDLKAPSKGALSTENLSRKELENLRLAEHEKIAEEEIKRLWLFHGEERERVKDFFMTLRKKQWRLETARRHLGASRIPYSFLLVKKDGTEVWRLPGDKIHTIMGVGTVNAPPKEVLALFDKPEFIFTRLFPRIDKMFIKGVATLTTKKNFTLCYAQFKLPNIVGPGAAPLVRNRDLVWTQIVSHLEKGNLLVSAKSYADPRFPEEKGLVRAKLLTSGYYGRVRKEDPDTTRVYYMIQADPAGVLPKWLVNMCAGKQAANVERLADVYKTGKLDLR